MKQEALITLRGIQSYPGEKPETVELISRGTFSSCNGKYAISYEETELTGTKGVKTTFFIPGKDRIVLTRSGAISSKMVFSAGDRHESLYDLGFGALLITIAARSLQVNLSENGGTVRIDYTVEVEQSATSHNSYELLIQPICGGSQT